MQRISLIVSALILCLGTVLYLKPPTTANNDEYEEQTEEIVAESNSPIGKLKKMFKRSPASNSQTSETYRPGIERSALDRENFAERPADRSPSSDSSSSAYVTNSQGGSGYSYSGNSGGGSSGGGSGGSASVEESTTTFSQPKTNTVASNDSTFFGSPTPTASGSSDPAPKKTVSNSGGGGYTSSSNNSVLPNTCTPSVVGGSFNAPIKVSITCNYQSTIKYCVGKDTGAGCCDPESVGSTYSAAVAIGKQNATYCLSYVGTNLMGETDVFQNTYTFNSTLPDLQVGHPKTYYQTTELTGKSFFTSLDFGKTGYSVGQINLKTHNPDATGDNLTCEEIVANYVGMPLPNPVSILSLLDVSLDTPSTQITIPFRADQMDYGDNFVTSFIENTNTVIPLYSCSTTKVVLQDFEYFDTAPTFGDVGTNTVREFSASISPYGFFEDEANVYRSPAGEGSSTIAGEKLEQGQFGIFY
jgi:hypothetical protein